MIEQLRQSRWIVLTALVLVGGGALMSMGDLRTDVLPPHPLRMAPEGAEIIARLDVPAVMGSHLFEVLLEEDTSSDVRRVEETCGYDPLEEVDEAVVFSMGGERPFEQLGFVARGSMARGRSARERLVGCVREVLSARGGGVSSIEVEGVSAVASVRGPSVAAFFGHDAVLGGDRDVVGRTIRVARGQTPSAAEDPDILALFDLLRASDLTVVGRVPDAWLPVLMRMASGLDPDVGVLLGVRTLGLGARLEDGVELRLALRSSEEDAGPIEALVTGQVGELLRDLRVRLSALGTVLRGLEVERAGPDVMVRVRASDAQVDSLRLLWAELGEPRDAQPSSDPEAED